MQKSSVAIAAVAALAGLTLGFGAREGIVGAAHAQPTPPGISRWDYYCLEASDIPSLTSKARASGAQGWEMVATSFMFNAEGRQTPVWCFKRLMVAPPALPPAAK